MGIDIVELLGNEVLWFIIVDCIYLFSVKSEMRIWY